MSESGVLEGVSNPAKKESWRITFQRRRKSKSLHFEIFVLRVSNVSLSGLRITKPYSFTFVADGLSTSLSVDVSLLPFGDNFAGIKPSAVLSPLVSSTFTGPLSGVTAAVQGTTVTFTFSTPPPAVDGSSNIIEYTATFVLQF
jgi:hypothetical protein